jgi:transcriptional regulator with XRE-family HTH domain
MTQLDLATAACISVAFIGRLEAGAASCTVEVLDKIARALAVNIADLLPSTSPPDTTAQLQERVRSLADRLVQKADQQTLSLAAQLLARLNDQ